MVDAETDVFFIVQTFGEGELSRSWEGVWRRVGERANRGVSMVGVPGANAR